VNSGGPRGRVARRVTLAGLVLVTGVVFGGRLLSNRSPRPNDIRASSPTYSFPQTGFGGYQWSGSVNQISATWRVPTIVPGSPSGAAATWIGAQASTSDRFIQVGVFEQCSGPSSVSYRAFWSDTTLKFIPQWIGYVAATDSMTASLVRTGRGWTVRLADTAAKLTYTTQIDYGVGSSFTTGEWIQEDPSPSAGAVKDVPYPDMNNVTFQHLQVNGQAPRPSLFSGLTLSPAGGAVRTPTSVRNDSFTFSLAASDAS
jgi:hypothetical protein